MNVLILGSAAREHALALACVRSPQLDRLFVAPGNPGCAEVAEIRPLSLSDHEEIARFCRKEAIDLVIVGPEAPLVAGIADRLARQGTLCFGPSQAAARLEGSKGFAKDFCREFGIPTAKYRCFRRKEEAKRFVQERGAPIVIKADGLAAGKGVIVAMTPEEAESAVDTLFFASDGGAEQLVVEEFLEGEEVSFFALCNGSTATPFSSAQDHKRVGDGDTGPNTGGMGAYSPPPVMTRELSERVMREIIMPTVHGMWARGTPYRGVLFAGLMITREGPKLVEFNARFGDPEAEVVLARLADDLLPLLHACAEGRSVARPQFSPEAALAVVMAAKGYPGDPIRGAKIKGIERAQGIPGVTVLQGATRKGKDSIIADGGRVLTVTATGGDITQARERAYSAVDRIDWRDGFFRRDIGWRALAYENALGGGEERGLASVVQRASNNPD